MVEHLSEGDIRLGDKSLLTLDGLQGRDFHALFRDRIEKKKFRPRQKGGIAVYFDVFGFLDVVSILREQYRLRPTEEDIQYGSKFSFALYFDRDLHFLPDMTFFTESAYIRYYHKVPREEEFRTFEEDLNRQFAQDFDKTEESPAEFNSAMEKELRRYGIDVKNCRMQLLNNLETEGTNLHSFFIRDLEKAKEIDTANLRAYLYGQEGRRVNLDSKKESAHFHPQAFEEILQPERYPLGRFPSCTAYALSLMQQVAVNLSIGADPQPIRSVNGPPGTGKTTLLKDIFAQLVVQQAYDMAMLPERCIRGTEETVYYDRASIGVLPAQITENGIVVASSNNGAVKNIVDELPLCSGIDGALLEELKEADYFRAISNAKVSAQWKEDESGKRREELVCEAGQGEEKSWGVFSLEGGKAGNMANILTHIKHIYKYLEEEYLPPEEDVYASFLKQYEAVRSLRSQAQAAADSIRGRRECAQSLERERASYREEAGRNRRELEESLGKLAESGQAWGRRLQELQRRLEEVRRRREAVRKDRDSLELCLREAERNKPGLLAGRKAKEDYRNQWGAMARQLGELRAEDAECARQEQSLRGEAGQCLERQRQSAEGRAALQREFAGWAGAKEERIARLEEKIREYDGIISRAQVRPLDMEREYDEVQLSNPWFDEPYRAAQSRLFLAALRVRKQFLYENRRNLRAAAGIWGQQEKYAERKAVIEAAWHWINLAIPVVSSTFASFSHMCRHLGPETLGHLFVDEAGQALPQAAVGAVFRSRHVMVVGDPSQIKPVLTLDSNTLSMLGGHFGVTEKYLSASASAQTLVDAASRYGFYRRQDQSEDSWIGIPLWVHRRCQYPMFTISNVISYDGFMVQGKKDYGRTGWFDIGGRAANKYVAEQGEFLKRKILELMEEDPKIGDKREKDVIYVITPFSNAAYQLSRKLDEIKFTRYDDQHRPTNVGTVHTFQGKEAPVVFFVLGADRQSSGAARWAVSEPNIMNVAATRAKKAFYVVGDRSLYLGLGCDVAAETDRIIRQYKALHPELVEDAVRPMPDGRDPAGAEAAEAPAAPGGGSPPRADGERVTGTVQYLGKGSRSFYAYVSGDDGKEYSIPESIYAKTERAEEVIQKGRKISFVPKRGAKKLLADDVKPEAGGPRP